MALRTTWTLFGMTLLLLALLDFCAHALVSLKKGHWNNVDWHINADAYDHSPWARDYQREMRHFRLTWVPFVYWRGKPFHGSYINVDDSGLRHTENLAKPGTPKIRIFVFGGSVAWGEGVRDRATIASCLSRILSRNLKQAIEVTNFGQMGYVSNQELIALYRELQNGNKPDYVVFFDGFNEAYASYQNHAPGAPQNESNRKKGFELVTNNSPGGYLKEFFFTWATNSSTYRIMTWLQKINPAAKNDPLPAELAKETVNLYAANVKTIEKLGEWKKFEPLFYWQPAVYDKPHQTAYEETQVRAEPRFGPFYAEVVGNMKTSTTLTRDARFHDLSSIFANETQPLFIDNCHFSETGSEMVARKIAQDLIPIIAKRGAN